MSQGDLDDYVANMKKSKAREEGEEGEEGEEAEDGEEIDEELLREMCSYNNKLDNGNVMSEDADGNCVRKNGIGSMQFK